MNNFKTVKCDNLTCDTHGSITLDLNSTSLTCGIKGVIDISNARLSDNKVICSSCNVIIYEDGRK
jgi:hypothetical protein